ncbi:probable galacturonosyltransferase 3 isoform X2 [Euphorbia lathyris]|uniref:probable galacturonosyltransferase 3 isoform X2 n=1 Tax=Euphorbia lathyris TaxID=212925 RepID=UPI0033143CFF
MSCYVMKYLKSKNDSSSLSFSSPEFDFLLPFVCSFSSPARRRRPPGLDQPPHPLLPQPQFFVGIDLHPGISILFKGLLHCLITSWHIKVSMASTTSPLLTFGFCLQFSLVLFHLIVHGAESYVSPPMIRILLLPPNLGIVYMESDTSGGVRIKRVKMKDLSTSWVLENPVDRSHVHLQKDSQTLKDSSQSGTILQDNVEHSEVLHALNLAKSPVKLQRLVMRLRRRDLRTALLIQQDKEADDQIRLAAIRRSGGLDTTLKGKYSIWRRDFENPNSESVLNLMRDQIIMAKAYANIAKSDNETTLYNTLIKHYRESQRSVGEATSDAELPPSALAQANAMGHVLALAKDRLYECSIVSRKLRAMLQSSEENVNSLRKKSGFLIQLAAKTVPKPLHCLPLKLAADYFLNGYQNKGFSDKEKLEDPSLYHYAIFSDNVLATSVVVNSTVLHSINPEKHVFHIVTDKLNFAAMKMWFIVNPPPKATVEVQSIDDFKWLNASYCSVLRQLESARVKEYYFKANNPSSFTAGADNLKYRNPKYLSMLNHLRFYLPEVYPKLYKILFLDDDIVVQKDLTPLWSVDLHGMVNGAVETCKESFHRFDKYLNFSNPKIYKNFDANACGWAFGMNMFDLNEWRKQNITGIYHHWQDLNEDRTLWKLGTLPPGLITFYNLTYPLNRSWHALGLGYDPALNQTEIENAAVVHYNGNYKPWLDLAIAKYKSYWSRYVQYDNPYLQLCNIND